MFMLGTPERERYTTQVSRCGPAELKAMGEYAIATNNRTLAAVVKQANDSLDPKHRAMSSVDLCDRLWGTEANVIWKTARAARNAVNRAVRSLREIRTGTKDSLGKISSGIRADKPERTAAKVNPSLGTNHPNNKIARGINSL
jgi:hypothetical protein